MLRAISLPKIHVNSFFQVLGGSLLIALCAQIAIPLPFTPVPLALGSLAPLILGAVMDKKYAVLAVLLYLIEGAMGLPVFALGGSGLARIMGPSGGYLMGYILSAYIVGRFKSVTAMVAGSAAVLAVGALHLASFVGIKNALFMGVLPFLAGDLILKPLVAFSALRKKSY
ncbi:MAG: biotin transporter BioY [Verrucomicrobia bacterium]|nr:biotin transporter BioY [Verrucomicrobiota bacterium]